MGGAVSQGWQDDQDGEGFALFDVGSVSVNDLIAGGVVRSVASTGLLQNGLVSYADIQLVGADRLLGNPTGSTATVSEIALGTGLAFSGATLVNTSPLSSLTPVLPLAFSGGTNLILDYDGTSLALSGGTVLVRAALTGDVAAPAGSNTTTIQPHVVSYAKMQLETASTLLGNPTGSLGNVQEITLGTGLAFSGSVLNATGTSISLPASEIGFGTGTGFTGSPTLQYNGFSLGTSSQQEVQIYNSASGASGLVGLRLGTSSGFTHSFAMDMIGVGWSSGGGVAAEDVLFELNAGSSNQFLFSNFTGGPINIATGSSRTVRLAVTGAGAIQMPTALGAGGIVSAAVTTGQLGLVTIGSGLTFSGGTLSATGGGGGTVTNVTGAAPIAVATGTTTPVISLNIDSTLAVVSSNLGRAAITGDGSIAAGSNVFALSNIPTGTTAAGDINFTPIAAPTTPSAGHALVYIDSTSLNFAVKNSTGTVNHGIQSNAGTAHEWISAIAADGSVTLSQPAFTDISGQATLAQLPSIGANTLLGNPTGATAVPSAIALGSTSGVLQYLNGSPDTLPVVAMVSGQIPFGAASGGGLAQSSSLTWNNSTGEMFIVPGSATNGLDITGASSGVVGFHVKNSTNSTGSQVQTVVENSAGALGYFGISAPSFTGFAPLTGGQAFFGGDAVPVSIFTQTAQPIIFYANAVEVGRWLSGGGLQIPAQTAPGTPGAGLGVVYVDSTTKNLAMKNDAGNVNHGAQSTAAIAGVALTSLHDDGTWGASSFQAPITWPTGGEVLVSTGTSSLPIGDSTFSFDTTGHVLLSGNGSGVNIGAINTNVSFATGIAGNANRDRVQLNVGGGALGSTGTNDNTFMDVIPANSAIRSGVTSGIYATQRIRALTYTGVSSPNITEAASLYIDGKPFISGASVTTASYALHVASGTVRMDSLAGPGIVIADANGVLSTGANPRNASYKWSMNASSSAGIASNFQTVIVPGDSGPVPTGAGFYSAAGGTAAATTLAANYATNGGPVAYGATRAYSGVAFQACQNFIQMSVANGTNLTYLLYKTNSPLSGASYTVLASWVTGPMNIGTSSGASSGIVTGSVSIAAGDLLMLAVVRTDTTSAVLSLLQFTATVDLIV